jgi:acetyltransferase-like isoleucine patch superfamily enzyme
MARMSRKPFLPYMVSIAGMGLRNLPPPQYADSVIKNDVWIGDEVMMQQNNQKNE